MSDKQLSPKKSCQLRRVLLRSHLGVFQVSFPRIAQKSLSFLLTKLVPKASSLDTQEVSCEFAFEPRTLSALLASQPRNKHRASKRQESWGPGVGNGINNQAFRFLSSSDECFCSPDSLWAWSSMGESFFQDSHLPSVDLEKKW